MNGNNREQPSASGQPPSNASSLQPGHVYLRVIYLVTGDPRPPLNLGQVDINTTISALKDRIQHDLPEHPSPSEQRLIYQGRPLLRNEATLREVFRLEVGAASGPLPYTIHIVINPRQDVVPTTGAPTTTTIPSPLVTRPAERTNPLQAVETSAARLQDALARIQQQIELNRADLVNVQQRIGLHHHLVAGQPHQHIPAPVGAIVAVDANGQPTFTAPTPPRFNAGQPLEQQRNGEGLSQPNQTETQGTRAHSRTIPSMFGNHTAHPPVYQTAQLVAMGRLTSQPSQGPQGASAGTEGPQPPTGMASSQPASAAGVQQSRRTQPHPLPARPRPVPGAVRAHHPPHPPAHISWPHMGPQVPPTTFAWLVSSPAGPEALLFHAGHGFFTSAQASTTQQSDAQAASPTPSPGNLPASSVPAEDNGDFNVNVRTAQPGRVPRPAAPPLGQPMRNEVDNDLFAFLIQRGWLFLRLYLFMFVFSEPGTWKRWLLIVTAAIICLQPRNGPFIRALTAARGHLDNLIAPPAPRPRPVHAAQAAQQLQGQPRVNALRNAADNTIAQRPANVRGAVQVTPEEAAARLIRQHQDQNPDSWRNMFYRMEQSTALFLASLIPGVGERHVRAREEARREAERLEQERIRAEEEEAARAQADGRGESGIPETVDNITTSLTSERKADNSAAGDVGGSVQQSNSSAVQTREDAAEAEGLRNRNI